MAREHKAIGYIVKKKWITGCRMWTCSETRPR